MTIFRQLSNDPQRSSPTCFVEEVNDRMRQEAHAVAKRGTHVLLFAGLERPVNEHWPSNHISFRNKTPKPTVQAYTPVIAHSKVAVWWDNDVLAVNKRGETSTPHIPDIDVGCRWGSSRKIVSVRIEGFAGVMQNIWFVQLLTISVHNAVPQMNSVSWHTNDPLHNGETGSLRRKEHNDISAVNLIVRNQ